MQQPQKQNTFLSTNTNNNLNTNTNNNNKNASDAFFMSSNNSIAFHNNNNNSNSNSNSNNHIANVELHHVSARETLPCLMSVYFLLTVVGMGIGARVFDITRSPRPGGWYTIVCAIFSCIACAFYVNQTHAYASRQRMCARACFLFVALISVLVIFLSIVIDASYADASERADICYAVNVSSTSTQAALTDDYCCNAKHLEILDNDASKTTATATTTTEPSSKPPSAVSLGCEKEPARSHHASGDLTCLCCYYSDHLRRGENIRWEIKGNECSRIHDDVSPLLRFCSFLNLAAGLVLIAAMCVACCLCCKPVVYGPQLAVLVVPARSQRNL